VSLFASIINAGQKIVRTMDPTSCGWIQVARGWLTVNWEREEQGDGVGVTGESSLTIRGEQPSEILLFDLT